MKIIEKKVSMTELFFDLVFVGAVSKMTHMIHLHHGVLSILDFSKYLITFITWINVWMLQTVFTNRYSEDDIIDQIFTYFNMFILLMLLNFVNNDFKQVFIVYNRLTVIVTISQVFQYTRQFYKRTTEEDKKVIKGFIWILIFKTLVIGIGGLLPYDIGVIIVIIGILVAWLHPLLYINKMKKIPVNFPNLVERVTLLVIITFGETILSIVSYLKVTSYTNTFLAFVVVASLFFYYKVTFNEIIDHHNENATGIRLNYSHYIILIGINMVTLSISALTTKEVNNIFLVGMLYSAFLVFYLGIFLNYKYNKKTYQYSLKCIGNHFGLLIIGVILSFIIRDNHTLVLGLGALINIFAAINIWKFYKL